MIALLLLLAQDDGAKAYAEGRYADAAAFYQKAVEKNPAPELQAALGRCRLQLREWDAAVRAFEAALKPDSPADVHRGLGHAHFMAGRTDAALASLRRAARLDPEGGDGLWIARALAQNGEWLAAEHEAARLSASDERNELLAWLLSRRGRHAEAADVYRALARRLPKHWVSLAQSEAAAGREGPAIDALETARRLGPLDAASLRLLADLYLQARMPREAAGIYAAIAAPGVEDLLRLGHARLQAGETVSARDVFEKALKADPGRKDALVQLGHLAPTPDEARRRFREAKAFTALGELEMKEGGWAAAADAFAEAIQAGDRTAAAHHNRAFALKQAGQAEAAWTALRDGLRDHPLDERLRLLLRSK